MTSPIVVVGAGGFGREVLELIDAINAVHMASWEIIGVADDGPSEVNLNRLATFNVPYLGTVDRVLGESTAYRYVLAIGSPGVRRVLAAKFDAALWRPATLIHPDSTVGREVSLGEGTIICAGARVTTNVRTGRHVHVDANATVGHDTTLGEFVRLNPGSSVSGDCHVGDGSLVGVAASIINQRVLGENVVVGAGACVVTDVEAGRTVTGVPARVRSDH